uniref:helix-turn-helix domain-containing protein n=1 Tax=Gelidibacter sp. TaxID=2018083 RepID=UPI004049E6E8
MIINNEFELALNFANTTDRSIFLTGKAGTGKTTFLHKLKEECSKRLIIVAPTGVAAINAKGVTIHSFFQLPFGPIVPNGTSNHFSHRFSASKIDIIKSLDLLIIDEISMVRSDLLDAIDDVLRRYKDKSKVFGGVQLIMIGDLQQLSPVVKDAEWQLLKAYYDTSFFFGSKAFKQCQPIYIELKHIYRQSNQDFINILNEIRNNRLSEQSAKALNTRFLPNFVHQKQDDFITLTTHNYKADQINDSELHQIRQKNYTYKAVVDGKFTEFSYPAPEILNLKVGAQVMFIKNDSSLEKRYYNGKIGKVISLKDDLVVVQCPSDDFEIEVTPEVWDNVSYSIDAETKAISETKIGSFSQIPLRLAWAITIHKSQGLTFEKAIIDAEDSFAHGQTYVALSRCKSLEGIVLKTSIQSKSIINDTSIDAFNKTVEAHQPSDAELKTSQRTFQFYLIDQLFNYRSFLFPVNRMLDIYANHPNSIEGNIKELLPTIKENGITELLKINTTFQQHIQSICGETDEPEKSQTVQERFIKAISYFKNHTKQHLLEPIQKLTFSTDNTEVNKDLSKHYETIEALISLKMFCFEGLSDGFSTSKYLDLRAKAILQNANAPKKIKPKIETTTKHPILFERLRELRADFAIAEDVAHYQIFTQKALFEMCQLLPTNSKQLQSISDIGKVRYQKYGNAILEIIKSYCNEFDVTPENVIYESTKPVKKENTKTISYTMFKNGKTIAEIAKERQFATTTIEGHLASFIESGDIKITELMPEETYLELKKIMETIPYEGFSDLKSKIDEKFTYSQLRMVFAAMNSKVY